MKTNIVQLANSRLISPNSPFTSSRFQPQNNGVLPASVPDSFMRSGGAVKVPNWLNPFYKPHLKILNLIAGPVFIHCGVADALTGPFTHLESPSTVIGRVLQTASKITQATLDSMTTQPAIQGSSSSLTYDQEKAIKARLSGLSNKLPLPPQK